MLTLRAVFRHAVDGAAVVTVQMLIGLSMHGKIGIAMWALRLPATTFTNQHRRIAATI